MLENAREMLELVGFDILINVLELDIVNETSVAPVTVNEAPATPN